MTGLGVMLGPLIYGVLQDYYPKNPEVAMAFVFWCPVAGLICLALAAVCQKQSYEGDVKRVTRLLTQCSEPRLSQVEAVRKATG